MPTKWLIDTEEIDRIVLDDGEWVEVKAKLTVDDQDKIAQGLVKIEPITGNREDRRTAKRTGDTSKLITTTYKPSTAVLLIQAITGWSFTDNAEVPVPVPVTPDNIRRMDPMLAALLEDEINDRNPTSSLQEKSTPETTEKL